MSDTVSVDTNFVVYAYVRENGTPYYIGKGRPHRPYTNGGRPCSKPLDKSRIVILHENIDEQTAFRIEMELIAKYKRKDLYSEDGLLRNKSDGGQGSSGSIRSEEQKKNLSLLAKERFKVKENNPMYGRTHTPEVRKILSDKAKKVTGRNHHRTKLYDWHHKKHGEVLSASILELINLFPEQQLKYTSLYDVVKERSIYSKGWTLLKNKDYNDTKKFASIKKLCSWSHEIYGLHENISAPDLVKKFPSLYLNRACLNALSLGKIKEYKGWIIVNSNCNSHVFLPNKSNWYHPIHGLQENVTIKSLVETFPDQKLNPSKLFMVRNGKRKSHKGWIDYKE